MHNSKLSLRLKTWRKEPISILCWGESLLGRKAFSPSRGWKVPRSCLCPCLVSCSLQQETEQIHPARSFSLASSLHLPRWDTQERVRTCLHVPAQCIWPPPSSAPTPRPQPASTPQPARGTRSQGTMADHFIPAGPELGGPCVTKEAGNCKIFHMGMESKR